MKTKNIKTVNLLWLPFYIFCLHLKKIQKAAFSSSAIASVGVGTGLGFSRSLIMRTLMVFLGRPKFIRKVMAVEDKSLHPPFLALWTRVGFLMIDLGTHNPTHLLQRHLISVQDPHVQYAVYFSQTL